MKKTFTLLLGLLGLASSVNAENLPIAGGWQWTVPMYSCSVTFNQEWAELGLCSTIGNGGLSLSDYKGVKITFNADGTPVADKLQIKVKNAAGAEQYNSNDEAIDRKIQNTLIYHLLYNSNSIYSRFC